MGTDLYGELNECEFQVLLETSVPKTTEKAKNISSKNYRLSAPIRLEFVE